MPRCTYKGGGLGTHEIIGGGTYVGSKHVSNVLLFGLRVCEGLSEAHLDIQVLSGIHLNI